MSAQRSTAVTLADASRQLGISAKTLRRWIDRQEIGALFYQDDIIRIEQAEIDRIKARAYRPAKAAAPAPAPPGGWRVAPVQPRARRTP